MSSGWPLRSRRRPPRPRPGSTRTTIRRIARELAAAPSAAVYGRIGTCTQEFGTLASWLVDVLNFLTGNLDREGGAMFPLGAAGHANATGAPGKGRGVALRPLAEPRPGPRRGVRRAARRRASPRRSTRPARARSGADHDQRQPGRLDAQQRPARRRARAARASWSAIDVYVNETTRHADVILPGPVAAAPLALRPRAVPVRGPQRRQLLTPVAAARAGAAGRVGDAAAADRRRSGARPERRRRRARRAGRAGRDRA